MLTTNTLALTANINGTNMNKAIADQRRNLPQHPNPLETRQIAGADGDTRTAFILTTDLDSGNYVQSLAADHGLDLQVRFPREGWPKAAGSLFIALDQLLLDARGRREYVAWLQTLKPSFPIIVLSYDYYLDPPTVVRPGLMLAVRLDDDVFCALRDGHIDLPADIDEERKAA